MAHLINNKIFKKTSSGQSYKHFTLVNYDSRVVPDWKIPHITTLYSMAIENLHIYKNRRVWGQ